MRASNDVSLTGNLGGDVEVRATSGGGEVARLSLAESITRLDPATGKYEQVHTNWIPIAAFGNLAKRAASSLRKGDRITVRGAIKTTSYEKDGASRRGFEVIAQTIEKAIPLGRPTQLASDASNVLPDFNEFEPETLAVGASQPS